MFSYLNMYKVYEKTVLYPKDKILATSDIRNVLNWFGFIVYQSLEVI